MIKKTLMLLLLSVGANASLFDFMTVNKAKEAYENKEYQKAEKFYQNLEGDEARFNEADALYHQKKYKEALEKYETIKSDKLTFQKLYNMGNSYAQMKKIDEGIDAYEKALKIKKDSNLEHNLELLKKKKKEQEKKKKENKKDKKNQKDKNQKNQKKDSDKKGDKSKKEDEAKEKEKQKAKKEKESQKEKEAKKAKEDKKDKKDKNASKPQEAKKDTPISNVEERKWQKMLNKRGVNTLMIPLPNKGEKRNETNPW